MSNYDIEFEGKMFKREKFEHEAVEEKIPRYLEIPTTVRYWLCGIPKIILPDCLK